ncbi:5-oxoprolinase subunit PxpB [Pseudomonas taiwanensis]|uniref:5-oxoprolinase subunit PxpB n=1 Tax=Pseudomonas taiwanensis TaxID=470150 RepID=UPI000485FA95|nr:5-oxoprolinase subunit PxpB [Pseudomonas taiwanensis]
MTFTPRLSLLGESALLLEVPGPMSLETQRKIWGLHDIAVDWPGIREVLQGMNNLLFVHDPLTFDFLAFSERVTRAWTNHDIRHRQHHCIKEMPVSYGGPDLLYVAERTGLSPVEVAELHASATYTVFALGSSPGFAYLAGIPEQLIIPRRKEPLLDAPALSVMIAGEQTGVRAAAGPTGWYSIGVPLTPVFDVHQTPPSYFLPGDTVRFVIDKVTT